MKTNQQSPQAITWAQLDRQMASYNGAHPTHYERTFEVARILTGRRTGYRPSFQSGDPDAEPHVGPIFTSEDAALQWFRPWTAYLAG